MNLKRVVVGLLVIAGLLAIPASASAIKFAPSPGGPVTVPSPHDVVNDFVVADVDDDGKDDIVSVSDSSRINVMLANAAGTGFSPPVGSPYGTLAPIFNRTQIFADDYDGDFNIDLLIVSETDSFEYVFETYLGNGLGDFPYEADFSLNAPVTPSPTNNEIVYRGGSAMGDINQDGYPDIVTGMSDHHYMVAVGSGTGQFTLTPESPINVPTTENHKFDELVSTAIGDWNGDGRNDVAFVMQPLTNEGTTPPGIYEALKAGGNVFDPATHVASGFGPLGTIAAIDLDHDIDGYEDASFTVPYSDEIRTLTGSFGGLNTNPADPSSAGTGTGSNPRQQVVADLNLDGNEDVATSIYGEKAIAVARSGGNGTIAIDNNSPFDLPPISALPFFPDSVATGDFNGDGGPDLASSSSGPNPTERARGIDVLLAQRDPLVTPSSIDFPDTAPSAPSPYHDVNLKNDGSVPIQLTGVSFGGGVFGFGNGSCATAGDEYVPLQPGEECDLNAYFAPSEKGAFSSNATLTFNGSIVKTVSLTGRTGPATTTVDPDEGLFGTAITSYVPDEKTLTFTFASDGGADLSLGTPVLDGFDAEHFSIVGSTCTGGIPTGSSCTVQVKFKPTGTADGFQEAELNFPDSNLGFLLEIPLEGYGRQSEYSVTPTSKSFGNAKVGTGITRTSQTFVVDRTGQIAVPFNGASLTGTNADSFSITSNDCPPVILDQDIPCEIKVAFDPKSGAAGARSANLAVDAFSSATPGSPTNIPLTGTATVDPPVPTCLTDPALCPPAGKAKLAIKLSFSKTVKRGKTLVVKATVRNTGDATARSISLKTTVPKKFAKAPKAVKVSSLAAGRSVTRKIKVKVKKSAKKGKKLKLKVVASATGVSSKSASRTVKIK